MNLWRGHPPSSLTLAFADWGGEGFSGPPLFYFKEIPMAKGPTKKQGSPRCKGGAAATSVNWVKRIALKEMKQSKKIKVPARVL